LYLTTGPVIRLGGKAEGPGCFAARWEVEPVSIGKAGVTVWQRMETMFGWRKVVVCLLVVSAGPGLAHGGEGPSFSPARILDADKFYQERDPFYAASWMLAEAKILGVDIDRVPEAEGDFSAARIRIPPGTLEFDVEDRSYREDLVAAENGGGAASIRTGILALARPMTIAEMADLLGSGVAVLARSGTGYVVSGAPGALLGLFDEDFVRWLGPYEEEYKYDNRIAREGRLEYSIACFSRDFRLEYLRDLDELGLELTGIPVEDQVGVRCEWRELEKVLGLYWVREVTGPVPSEDDDGLDW